MSVLITFLCIVLIIVLHELGHFIAAKLIKAPVPEFSVGFGPRLCKKEINGTTYSIRGILLGGYCAVEDVDENGNKLKPLSKLFLFAAGPLMNFLFCFVLIVFALVVIGKPIDTTIVDGIEHGYEAEGKLLEGDRIIKVNGIELTEDNIDYVFTKKSVVTVERDGKILDVTIYPTEISENFLATGIIFKRNTERFSFPRAVMSGFRTTGYFFWLFGDSIAKLFRREIDMSSMQSVVGVVNSISSYARVSQLSYFFLMLAYLSCNLGIINLFPIPGLDGSQIVESIFELITRRMFPQRLKSVLTVAGITFIVAFGIVFVLKDIVALMT